MNTQQTVKMYIEQAIKTQGFVCPSIGPMHCKTNQLVFKDVALDMGLEYALVNKKTIMVLCKEVK